MPAEHSKELQEELKAGLRNLESQGRRRTLVELKGVNLCSNDYLGLSKHCGLREAVERAVREAGRMGGTGSRLLSGHDRVWDELEEEFAEFAGTEAALYFGSGYAANIGLLTAVVHKGDTVFSDERNHASLIDGIRLSGARKIIYAHRDLRQLEAELQKCAGTSGRKYVVTETVFSMDGDVAPIAGLAEVCERHGAELIVDEAHATAVHGPSGRGMAAAEGVSGKVLGLVHTCGKALASVGAFVCGSSVLREHLINHARTFIFSTAMPSYMAGQIRAALRLARGMDGERAQLLDRSRKLTKNLRLQGWDTGDSNTQIVPVIVGENEEAVALGEFLQQKGFAVRAIRPPTVAPGCARLRLSLTRDLAANELEHLESCLSKFRAQKCATAMMGTV